MKSLTTGGAPEEYAYTRYVYPIYQMQSQVYTTVTDTNNNGKGDAPDEVLAESWTDGAGRVYKSRTPMSWNTSGATITWSASKAEYDIRGQVKRSTVPTEIDANWNPTGDDNRGIDANQQPIWLWTSQEYDWKGRVIKSIPTDSTGNDGKEELISYEGCGCAGGQVTTIQSALVPRDDQPNTLARRTQKVYADILGRNYKTEVLNWSGTVYSSTVTNFNGRDQATSIVQTDYSGTSPVVQTSTMTYDGHGRLQTSHRPEQQNANGSPAFTTYNYNEDDSISAMTDARGAGTSYGYHGNGQVNLINYSVPAGSTIPLPDAVSFDFDALGNVVYMEDGLGRTDYEYNQLSQLKAETRRFDDSLPNAPLADNKFKIQYTYGLSGQLSSVTDPYSQVINYAFDKVGRLNAVTGSSFGGVTNYAHNPAYRAWGGLKSLTYGNGTQMQTTFNNRLQTNHFELNKADQTSLMKKNYEYYQDGGLKYTQDLLNPKFDRLQKYDHAGRIKQATSGAEARGQTPILPLSEHLPYSQSYKFNGFNNLTERNNLHWGTDYWHGRSNNLGYDYLNNRITHPGYQHDADGRVLVTNVPDDYSEATYDAAGRLQRLFAPEASDITRNYDGAGREVKRVKSVPNPNAPGQWMNQATTYYVRSSVFGGEVLSEVNYLGKKQKTNVIAAGTKLATQGVYYNDVQGVTFTHADASGASLRHTRSDGTLIEGEGTDFSPAELDGLGGNVGLANPYIEINPNPPNPEFPAWNNLFNESPMMVNGQRATATLDGFAMDWGRVRSLMERGGAAVEFLSHIQGMGFIRTQSPIDSYGIGLFGHETPPTWIKYYRDGNHIFAESNAGYNFFAVSEEESFRIRVTIDLSKNPLIKAINDQGKCDTRLAGIFGGDGAVMGSLWEPKALRADGTRGKYRLRDDLGSKDLSMANGLMEDPDLGVVHLFANKDATGVDEGNAFTPPGFMKGKTIGMPSISSGKELQNFQRFYYAPGSLSKYGYSGGLIINFTHIGPTDNKGKPAPPNPKITNKAGSVLVGVIGAYGSPINVGGYSEGGFYAHVHMIFNTWDGKSNNINLRNRIDPRKVFCKDFGF